MGGRIGYRFHPTEEELVDYFLKHKMDGNDFLVDDDIHVIDLCSVEPWDLPKKLGATGTNEQVWYFFCRRELKYKNTSGRQKFNRSTNAGHWKPTGNPRLVKARSANKPIGTKRTLVFYKRATPKGVKTNWVIHEYQPETVLPHQKDFVLCKLKEKSDNKADTSLCVEGESSRSRGGSGSGPPNDYHQPPEIPISPVDPEVRLASFFAGNGANFNPLPVLQPQLQVDEGLSINDLDDLMMHDVFDNDTDALRYEVLEEDPIEMADFLYSLSADIDGYNSHETASTHHLHHSSSPQSLSGVFLDDISDVDAYGISSQFGASNLNYGHASSTEYRQTRRVQSITETLKPSTYNESRSKRIHFHQDDILVMEATSSSADSAKDSTEDIKCIGVVSKEFTADMRTRAGQPRSGNILAEQQGKMSGTSNSSHMRTRAQESRSGNILEEKQGKMSGTSEHKAKEIRKHGTALDLPRANITVKTEKDQKMINAKTGFKSRANDIDGNNMTGSFIRLETCIQTRSPASVYIVNVLIGLVLFVAASGDLLGGTIFD